MMAALALLGLSMGLLRAAAMGIDPYSGMVLAVSGLTGVGFGTMLVLFNCGLLLFQLLQYRALVGIGTFINMFLLGYLSDFVVWLLGGQSLAWRLAFLLAGCVLMCFSVALYMTANLGVSPYDALAIILAKKLPRLPYRALRITTDSLCVLLAVVLLAAGGEKITTTVGLGTVLTALCTGPLVQFFQNSVAVPLIYGRK